MFSPQITELLENLKKGREARKVVAADGDLIQVNRLTSKAGVFYEKVRYLVDYKEEHTIRRSAIERILKRRLILENDTKVGHMLLEELVTGGYLPNNYVSESGAAEVQRITDKFLLLYQELSKNGHDSQYVRRLLINMTASEIELLLYPTVADELVLDAFYKTVRDRVKSNYLPVEELNIQTYIACRRGLLNNDDDKLFYHLFLTYLPQWSDPSLPLSEIGKMVSTVPAMLEQIRHELKHPIRWQLVARLKNYSIYFSVTRELLERFGVECERVFSDREYLDKQVRELIERKSKRENKRTRESGMRAVFYILFTKIILAFILELPYELKVLNQIDYLPLTANVVFHPLLLFVMANSARLLDEKNTQAVISGVHAVLYGGEIRAIMLKSERSGFLGAVFLFLYALIFISIFSGLLSILYTVFHFNVVSIALFVFFLTLVSYFGLRIRYNAKRYLVEQSDDRTLPILWSVVTLPITRAGRWLSTKFAAVNIFVLVLDFLIETPFKMILKFSDAFLSYLKEKREDTV